MGNVGKSATKLARIASFGAVAALALALAACKWTAHADLMPVPSHHTPPIAIGTYAGAAQGSATHTVGVVPGTKVLTVTVPSSTSGGADAVYYAAFDQIEGAYYLVEVFNQDAGRVYLVLRARPDGYDYWQPGCAPTIDGGIATAAGAGLETSPHDSSSNDCVFSSYTSLLQAARGIVAAIRNGTYGGQMTSFNRS